MRYIMRLFTVTLLLFLGITATYAEDKTLAEIHATQQSLMHDTQAMLALLNTLINDQEQVLMQQHQQLPLIKGQEEYTALMQLIQENTDLIQELKAKRVEIQSYLNVLQTTFR